MDNTTHPAPDFRINPATGYPMHGFFDSAGNAYGLDRQHTRPGFSQDALHHHHDFASRSSDFGFGGGFGF